MVPKARSPHALAIGRRVAAASTSETGVIPKLALVLIAAITILWGLNWPAMKFIVGQLEPWTFRAICVFTAGTTLLIWSYLSSEPTVPRADELPLMALAALFGVTGWHMFTAYGLLFVGGGRAAIIAFTMPVWAMLLSVIFLGERFDRRRLLALAAGMSGIGLLVADSLFQLGQSPLGTLLIACAAVSWACSTICIKAHDWSMGTTALSGWLLLMGGLPIAGLWWALEAPGDFSKLTLSGALALFYTSFVALVFCYTSFLRIVRLVPASVAAISTTAIPVVGVISAALVLDEPIGWQESLALVLVLGALALVLMPQSRKAATE